MAGTSEVSRRQVLVAGRRFSVPFPGSVPTVPFLPEAEWIHAIGSINGEHAVEVVDFMLEELRAIGLEVDFLLVALEVLKSNPDPVGPLDPDHQIREGKAVVPDREVLGPDVDNLRIDEGPRPIHLDVDDPDWGADLGCRNGPPSPESRLPVSEGVPEIINDHSDRG